MNPASSTPTFSLAPEQVTFNTHFSVPTSLLPLVSSCFARAMGSILKTERENIVGASLPPPGVIPDFEHPESCAYKLIIANSVLFPLATLVVILRIYTRVILVRYMGSDDYAIILAWVLSIGRLTVSLLTIKDGVGVHIWNVPLTMFSPHLLQMAVTQRAFHGLSFMFVKVSILLLYLRLSPYYRFRIAVWVLMVIVVGYSIVGSFAFLFNCQPIAKSWDVRIMDGKCINLFKIYVAHGILNIITDIAMLLLPIVLVRKLKLPMKEKVALSGLFMTGTM
ncbi:hypothetical protein GQ44DRAFT_732480 [Phaeosphaeriaceae sp. PMI808]|nr:hypothetical protein GQ44DRAFT_732480 [Phaeosphaeriaceae sp. PMI808]